MDSPSLLIGTLRRWAYDNADRKAKLETWLDQAIEQGASNKGAHITNASAHGISFAAAGGLTWVQWAAVLSTVLQALDRNVRGLGRTTATFSPPGTSAGSTS